MQRSRNRSKPSSDDDTNMSAPRKKRARRDQDSEILCDEPSTSQHSSSTSQRNASSRSASLLYEPTLPSGGFDRCGKVISMRLTNFMCHSNFFLSFGPNINFLVGSNGSGKSAVITALALGLTSNARATNRASTIQKLIRNGETSASIEITLSNMGSCRFKPDIYGPHITVVRHIRQSSSTYDIKDAHGKSVSKKLDEIRRMLLRFGIYAENPIFLLNQDAAREFLKTLEPSSNYRLVMKATQLDNCALSLAECHKQRCTFNKELENQELKRNHLKTQLEVEEEKLTALQNKEDFKIKLTEAKATLAWKSVTRFQEELAKFEKSLSLIQAKKTVLDKNTSNKESTQTAFSQQLSELEATKNRIMDAYKAQEAKVRSSRQIVEEKALEAMRLKDQIKNSEQRIKEEEHSLQACQKYVENYHADYTKVNQLKEDHANTLTTLKTEMRKNDELLTKVRDEQLEIKEQISALKEHVEELRNEHNKLQGTKQTFQLEIKSLTRNQTNKLSVYGEQAMHVVNKLRVQYSGPNKCYMPRGPVGQYITVPNPKYRELVENELRSCLNGYIVNSDKDLQSLRVLLHQIYPGGNIPPIYKTPFSDRAYNISKHKVRTTANTTVLIDEICCEDPVVMNYLIDMFRIETVLVTESKATAEFLTSESENVPPNLCRVVVPNLGLEYTPSPNYGVYSKRSIPARYIQVDVHDRIRQLQNDLRSLQEREAPLEANYEQARQKLERAISDIQMKKSIIERYYKENEKAMQKIIDIENYEYQELPEYDRLKTSLADSTEKIQSVQKEREELQKKLMEVQKKITKAVTSQSDEAKILTQITDQVTAVEEESSNLESKIRSLDLHFEENSRNLKKTLELEREFISKQKAMECDLLKAREEAEKLGDFISTNQTEEQIRDEIGSYKSRIKQLEKSTYSIEQVENDVAELRTKLSVQEKEFRIIESVVKKLRMAYHERAQLFQKSRHHYFTMVQFQFEVALGLRNFRVSFNSNYRDKIWDINVYPPSGNETSNTRSLSGGERSFTTVSLLKGLWSTSEHPFYFLDEYDVFTDEVNRKFITQILINEGMDHKKRQYCFLTPQDTEVEASNFIRVHKLEPPER
ncbi:LOW QUALITY PROTEIN: structural maintenance of chromosomes protein 6 [Drosophila tropicalis]|uniref:LOW QUALITY PROTEIN: structural maintenance of chromosomes protein 6 n=1 Tax=Drosophila tropicalis TaxID=46794 RepID=UPI0035ABAB17